MQSKETTSRNFILMTRMMLTVVNPEVGNPDIHPDCNDGDDDDEEDDGGDDEDDDEDGDDEITT